VGRAGGQAEAAMDAVRGRRGQVPPGVERAGWVVHQIPPANRPGDIRCRGSNWSLTARISGSDGTGPHGSIRSRTPGGACTTTALASTGGLSGAGAVAGLASASPRATAARSPATNAATAAGSACGPVPAEITPAAADPPTAGSRPAARAALSIIPPPPARAPDPNALRVHG